MKHKNWILSGFILLPITLLMAYDFFPELNGFLQLSKPLLIGLILIFLFSGFFINRFQKASLKSDLLWQVILTSYLLLLLIAYTLLGGESQVGISLSNPFLWIVLLITFFDIAKQYKKMKTAQSNS
ncbi:hypothetical protein M3152_00935 [Sporosarcina luteola]|uniref:hypothetical protein n=1 Tax=Sporosarcina luteola TaxID=582850 RepID=UPI002040ADEA|nr:hypothetical protein [Sporosarcina luteola]MCM3636265.1 hypothetical protein [Sporosarcina luteola]